MAQAQEERPELKLVPVEQKAKSSSRNILSVSTAWFGALAFCSAWNLASAQVPPLPPEAFPHVPQSQSLRTFFSLSLPLPCNPKSVRFAPVRSTHLHLYLQLGHLLTTASPPSRVINCLKSNKTFYILYHTPQDPNQSQMHSGFSSIGEINVDFKLKGLGSNPSSTLCNLCAF